MKTIYALKLFSTGDFSEEEKEIDKTIPSEYKDEIEQIEKATMNVKKQIRDTIIETKNDSNMISSSLKELSDINLDNYQWQISIKFNNSSSV